MIKNINKLSQSEFVKVFANIFENASWIAKDAYNEKPFKDFADLSQKMLNIFSTSTKENQLKILKAHPDLADKTKIGSLTPDSEKEQSNAGLDQCSEEEFNEFKNLNNEYKKKFGFPFIYAVKGKEKKEILSNFRQRSLNDIDVEFIEAKKQVKKIASLRLNEKNFF
jgi:2-oxo-4-hydroxy-4-carboxy-5-ureidoimidazoline decarboxylase